MKADLKAARSSLRQARLLAVTEWAVQQVRGPDPASELLGWRAELWIRPYAGIRLAVTRTVGAKRQAVADGRHAFGVALEAQRILGDSGAY